MSKQQLTLLLMAAGALAMLVASLFVMPWFTTNMMGGTVEFDLRSASLCSPIGACTSVELSHFRGAYPIAGNAAFFSGLVVLVLVVIQTASRLVTGAANGMLTRIGYAVTSAAILAAFAAAYLFAPDAGPKMADIEIVRTWAPLAFFLGNVLALVALNRAITDWSDDVGEYKPIKLDRAEKGRLPVTPLSVNRVPLPDSIPLEGSRPRTPSSPPAVGRLRSPTQPPSPAAIEVDSRPYAEQQRTKAPSQQPVVARTTSPSHGVARANSPSQGYPRAPSPSQNLARSSSPAHGTPLVARTPSPAHGTPFVARTLSPTQGTPLVARTTSPGLADPRAKSPSKSPPVDPVERSRTSSSGPIDLSARLSAQGGPGLDVATASIRPPLPSPDPVPSDQIPIDPAAGLTIRKRAPSHVPLPDSAFAPPIVIATPPESGLIIRKKSTTAAPPTDHVPVPAMPAIAADGIEGLVALKEELSKPHAMPQPDPQLPQPLRGKLKLAVITLELASTGLRARREDGTDLLVEWDKIGGVVARRLPPDAPYESAPFVDIISTAGSTLRVVQWTRVTGGLPMSDAPIERARELVNVIAAQALGAKLDPATKLFADSDGQPAQLPTVAMLDTHDRRISRIR